MNPTNMIEVVWNTPVDRVDVIREVLDTEIDPNDLTASNNPQDDPNVEAIQELSVSSTITNEITNDLIQDASVEPIITIELTALDVAKPDIAVNSDIIAMIKTISVAAINTTDETALNEFKTDTNVAMNSIGKSTNASIPPIISTDKNVPNESKPDSAVGPIDMITNASGNNLINMTKAVRNTTDLTDTNIPPADPNAPINNINIIQDVSIPPIITIDLTTPDMAEPDKIQAMSFSAINTTDETASNESQSDTDVTMYSIGYSATIPNKANLSIPHGPLDTIRDTSAINLIGIPVIHSIDITAPIESQVDPRVSLNGIEQSELLKSIGHNLPSPIQNRVFALKLLQIEHLKVEEKFREEVFEMAKKYDQKWELLFNQRAEIITGRLDPPKAEPNWKHQVTEAKMEQQQAFRAFLKRYTDFPANIKGIPFFWSTVLWNSGVFSSYIEESDIPVLSKLRDLKITYDKENTFKLEFWFDENEYFTNQVLTKEYHLRPSADNIKTPLALIGPKIYKCVGCTIDWAPGKNLAMKMVTKEQKHMLTGHTRTVVKFFETDTVFNFFSPPQVPYEGATLGRAEQEILKQDFTIAEQIRTDIFPQAILYYTGDLMGHELEEQEEEDEADSEEEEQNSTGKENLCTSANFRMNIE